MSVTQPLLLTVVGALARGVVAQHAASNTTGAPSNSTMGGASKNATASGKPGNSSSSASHGGHGPPSKADLLNIDIRDWILYTWAAILVGLIAFRGWLFLTRYIRTIACLNNDTQHYFRSTNRTFGSAKRYIFESPLFRLRHNREFKLSSAVNIGTLPTRFQTFFLLGFLAMNITFCVFSIEWHNPKQSVVLAQLRNRTGVLATINMIPLVMMAGRNNR